MKMSMSAESYQRFESQKVVGKNYPWLAPHQIEKRNSTYFRSLSLPDEFNQIPTNTQSLTDNNFEDENARKSLNIGANNFDSREDREKNMNVEKFNITDDEKITALIEVEDSNFNNRNNVEEAPVLLRNDCLDRVPSFRAPSRPQSGLYPFMNRISTLKDAFLHNTESFIKDKIPRLPDGFLEKKHQQFSNDDVEESTNLTEVDNMEMPTRRRIVHGIDSDDIVAKFISFLGWNFFLLMRLLSLSVFSVFYPQACGWLCLSHYTLMVLMLINETRFKVKWRRTVFYFILAYIFIFNLIEFKVRFKSVRMWYVNYFILVITQNITMTILWYGFTEFLDTWWFEFMFLLILQSGIMSLVCFLTYFFYLKPHDRIYFVNEE
jgi:hypothetical protein